MLYRKLSIVLVLLFVGCGGDSNGGGSPMGPGPTIPNIVGSYSGTWRHVLFVPSTGEQEQLVCPATATVTNQGADGSFTGSWTQGSSVDCTADSGTMGGTVLAGGAMSITQFTSGSDLSIEELTGGQCTLTTPIGQFSGSANGSSFEMSGTAILSCLGIQVALTLTLSVN